MTVPPNPLITATARCGDNDNDPLGYFETSVASVAGGQICWGWDINNDLYCDHVTLRLQLVSTGTDAGIHFKAGSEYEIIDDTTTWGRINACYIQVVVPDQGDYGVELGVTSYNGNSSTAICNAGRSISMNRSPKGGKHGTIPVLSLDSLVFENQSYTDVDITAWISMIGYAPITRNAIVGKILLYGTTSNRAAGSVEPIIPEVIPPNCRNHWNRHCRHQRKFERR